MTREKLLELVEDQPPIPDAHLMEIMTTDLAFGVRGEDYGERPSHDAWAIWRLLSEVKRLEQENKLLRELCQTNP